jgi:hypothetical protein
MIDGRHMLLLHVFLLVVALVSPIAAVAAAPVEDAFVARLNAAIARAASADGSAGALCADVLGWAPDLDAMARTVFAGAWEGMDRKRRGAFRAAVAQKLIRECVGPAKTALRRPVELAGVRALPSGELLIGTRSAGAASGAPLLWRGRADRSGGFRVTDLVYEGRSAVLSMREAAQAAFARGGGDDAAVLEALQR